ncbi:A/G-specific adenine glycosylase [Maribacter sp. MMG018]|uniref:A/G-specific adenine glycosylase n=1 Tax=Maribacter sp. MMG018 TaxID=2822688 RepID=UPI001B37FA75|nr:A/G-specific adenine glycosylase [Maribacter sp. MMG018]MBQ4913100.1 A/G-specific adenine glycosylase [Maribacter sp. MMG018]
MSFSEKILAWYRQNKRELPWRNTIDPYNIWLSEIMLQQTRVAQGIPYYNKFIDVFPTVYDLSNAKEEQVLKLWQGLGYYSRARNLHAAAKMVVEEYNGVFPRSYKELLTLKGVGDYTASAIASICYNAPHAVVDGNVYRVLSRYFGVETPINSTSGMKYFKELAQELLHATEIRDYNQGIMEFGAIQCTPQSPACSSCPLNDGCIALKEEKVKELPVKIKKTKIRKRYFNYLIPIYKDGENERYTLLRQRRGKGIWQNLWEFPLLESDREIGLENIEEKYKDVLETSRADKITLYNDSFIVHKLSHQHLYTKFWILEGTDRLKEGINVSKLDNYAVPVLLADFMKTFKF